ncbi:MAG TPA: 4-(cytidine 5'-diphospho)-2-C-methyl-D-erythritol kinase [Jatrophihabitantaceae bacterium]
MPSSIRVKAPAKVNLHLGVGPVRPDGFHELVTVFHAVDLFDEVVASPADGLHLSVTGEGARDVPADESNLAWRAAVLLAEQEGVAPNVSLQIAKAIPVAGGMAGGSADAAATLVACAQLWDTGTPRAALADLCAQLGSDVVFPLFGGTAIGTGRGEVIAPALTTGSLHWVFALAGQGISTAEAYRELDRQRAAGLAPPPLMSADAMLQALRSGDASRVAAALSNDLEPAALALAPTLRRTLDAGRELGALRGIVSGSGATCAFLCSDAEAAIRLAAALTAEDVCRTTRVASGPAPGATLVG